MTRRGNYFSGFVRFWSGARPRTRLVIGTIVVAVVGIMGLTPNVIMGQTLIWPYAGMIAAAGWGRSGLAFSPVFVLMGLGFAQDVTSGAPIGCFALVNILVFGVSVGLGQLFDIERAPTMAMIVAAASIWVGFMLTWLIASFSGGYLARISPLVWAFAVTVLLHVFITPLYDLGVRRNQALGAAA